MSLELPGLAGGPELEAPAPARAGLDPGAPARGARKPWTALAAQAGPALVGVLTAALGFWQISRLSFNQDEAATLAAVRRPLLSMLAVLGHIDAVHGAYYLIMHVVLKLGSSEFVLRTPSVLAMAGAAALTVLIGSRLGDRRTGLAAGLIFGTLSLTTEYAQDARPFALAVFLAVAASWRFTVLAETGRRRDAAWYGVVLALAGLMNLFTVLIVVGHAITLVLGPARRERLWPFAWAGGAALVVISPVAWLAATQVGQVGWERRPGPALVAGIAVLLAAAAIGSALLARSSGAGDDRVLGSAPLIRLSAPWLVAPVTLLVAVSQVPVASVPGQGAPAAGAGIWEPRYLLFCLPAAALLAAAMLARLPRPAAIVTTVIAVAAAVATQPLARQAVSPDDLRGVSALIGAHGRSGDVVVFPDIAKRLITDAYPAGFARVRDVGLDTAAKDSLYGLNVPEPVLGRRLAYAERVWVVIFPVTVPAGHYGPPGAPDTFCLVRDWRFPLNQVLLYRRCQSGTR